MNKIKLGIFFGGRSGEHEVSLSSASNIISAADRSKYEVIPVGITKEGAWRMYTGEPAKIRDGSWIRDKVNIISDFSVFSGSFADIDVFFPVLHGTFGEDGTLQGFFEMLDKPYVGCGVLASALCMDKDMTKRTLTAAGIDMAQGAVLTSDMFLEEVRSQSRKLVAEFGLPLFVKPANLGSSVGITKAHSEPELAVALKEAAKYDAKVLVEKSIDGMELEVAILGNTHAKAAGPGQIVPCREFYDYEAKYLTGDDSDILIPAPIDEAAAAHIRETAIRAFKLVGGTGLARVDFFLTPEGRVVLNEINTLPGFTNISMYPKLWENEGLPQSLLVDRLIQLGVERYEERKKLKYKRDDL